MNENGMDNGKIDEPVPGLEAQNIDGDIAKNLDNLPEAGAQAGIVEPKVGGKVELSQEDLISLGLGDTKECEMAMNQVKAKNFEQLPENSQQKPQRSIDMLMDVTLPIAIELGRTNMTIGNILNLGPGSVVELNKLAGEPVDLLVNEKLIARGEVVVVDENFGIRITSMISQHERIKSLK